VLRMRFSLNTLPFGFVAGCDYSSLRSDAGKKESGKRSGRGASRPQDLLEWVGIPRVEDVYSA
jgi:hypothetical protein